MRSPGDCIAAGQHDTGGKYIRVTAEAAEDDVDLSDDGGPYSKKNRYCAKRTSSDASGSGAVLPGGFEITRTLGKGSFGEIFQAVDLIDRRFVAAKLELCNHPASPRLLPSEHNVYAKMQGAVGIPEIVFYAEDVAVGKHPDTSSERYNILVMELMGASLEELFRKCGRRFSMKTVLMLMDQMLTRLQQVHAVGYIHRDVKPENFMIGTGENDVIVYLIDFGLAKRYYGVSKSNPTPAHIPYRTDRRLTGTPRYVSVNTHEGVEQSRRDDLEALGYVMMYFLRGRLPWQAVHATSKQEKYEKIARIKKNTSIKDLCAGFPSEFGAYFEYCRLLYFEDAPDYSYLRRMFRRLFFKEGYRWDYVYDWS